MEGNHIEGKLNKFRSLVLSDAHEKSDALMREVEKRYTSRMDQNETELLKGAYEDIQNTVRTSQRSAGEKVLHTELAKRKRLIIKRDEIINAVMDEATEKLDEYRKTDEYGEWLLNKAKKAFEETGEGAKTVYLSESDMRFKDRILSLEPSVTVEAADTSGVSGGIRVLNTDRRVAADYTFKELLDEERRGFERAIALNAG